MSLSGHGRGRGGYEPLTDAFDEATCEGQSDGRSAQRVGKADQKWSYELTNLELKELYNARGCMPRVFFSPPEVNCTFDVAQRVDQLDQALKDRVQDICNRLAEAGSAHLRSCAQVTAQLTTLYVTYIHLGVIKEIVPYICFFAVYSLWVSYYSEVNGQTPDDLVMEWTATKQDSVYYPAVLLAFLISFRGSTCMARYKEGTRSMFEMQKCLREVTFEVMTHLCLDEDEFIAVDSHENPGPRKAMKTNAELPPKALMKKYFKHEFRRLVRLLFACAARDLSDSALGPGIDLDEEEAGKLSCAMTRVEHAAILVTHSAFGHAFRVYLAASWLSKLVRGVSDQHLFDDDRVLGIAQSKIRSFKASWLEARQVAYTSMPNSVTHILWMLTTAINLFMPWEWVEVCRWNTWLPSVLLTISFYGILQITNSMENPFGFDSDDIQIWEVADHLDEEICLTMHYASLDECGGENLYRNLMGNDLIYVGEVAADQYED